MKKICQISGTVFGFIDTDTEVAKKLIANKEYGIKKVKNELYGTYYEVYDSDYVITTLSESEYELFFGNKEVK